MLCLVPKKDMDRPRLESSPEYIICPHLHSISDDGEPLPQRAWLWTGMTEFTTMAHIWDWMGVNKESCTVWALTLVFQLLKNYTGKWSIHVGYFLSCFQRVQWARLIFNEKHVNSSFLWMQVSCINNQVLVALGLSVLSVYLRSDIQETAKTTMSVFDMRQWEWLSVICWMEKYPVLKPSGETCNRFPVTPSLFLCLLFSNQMLLIISAFMYLP